MIKHLLTVTFRNMTKQKGRSIISVLCITAGLLCFSICHYYSTIMSRGNKLLDTYERMAVIRGKNNPNMYMGFSLDKIKELGNEEILGIAFFTNGTTNFKTQSDAVYRISATFCNHDYFLVFPPKLIEGSLEEFDKRPEIIVVTKNFIRKYADAGTTIGSSVTLNKTTYTIGAIIESYPAGMNNYTTSYDLFIPSSESYGDKVLLLGKPSDIEIINKRLALLDWEGYQTTPQCYLMSQLPQASGLELYISIIGLIILIVALTNYFSFSISSFVNRSRELALRQCLGGKSSNIFGLLFIEQFIILTLSCILTLALSESLLPAFIDSLSYNIRRELEIDIPFLLISEIKYTVLIWGASFLLCYISVTRIIRHMHRKGLSGRAGKGKHLLRNISLGLQFFFSFLFLFGIAGIYFQMQSYSNSTTPLLTDEEKQNLIIIPTYSYDNKLNKELTEVCDYFRSKSWCESLSLFCFNTMNIKKEYVIVNQVTEEFLDQMKIEKYHKPGEKFAYITPTIDTEIRSDSSFQTIRFRKELEYPIKGQCHIFPQPKYGTSYLTVLPFENKHEPDKIILQLKQGANRKQALQEIKEKINTYYPANATYEATTLYDEQVGELNVLQNLFIVCAIISLLITILGIYHSIQIDTERRQKEVAIRKVNGAHISDIYWLFGKSYVTLYLIAMILAIPICLFLMIMADSMIKFDYGHPMLWSIPMFVAAMVIILTISWRIYRIARINPAEIIKNE